MKALYLLFVTGSAQMAVSSLLLQMKGIFPNYPVFLLNYEYVQLVSLILY